MASRSHAIMFRVKAFVIIPFGGFIHFAAMMKIIGDRLTCDMQPHCVSQVNKIVGAILEFPLGSIAAVIHHFDADFDVMNLVGGEMFAFLFLNSILAVTLVWIVLVRPFIRQSKRSRP